MQLVLSIRVIQTHHQHSQELKFLMLTFGNAGTKFGAMLDMLTDRCATMCLLATLGSFYPSYIFVFQMVMAIDISCHWVHLHTSNVLGKTSHKNIGEEENPLLRFYYTSRPFLFFMCAGNELFYSMLYLLHFTYGWTCKQSIPEFNFIHQLHSSLVLFSFRNESHQGPGCSSLPCSCFESCSCRHARRFCLA